MKMIIVPLVWHLLMVVFLIDRTFAIRIEDLKEIHKDSTSITIEWSINTGNLVEDDQWIGFKIKYFTDKLQYTPILLKNINLRKFRLDNLKSNTLYKVQVSAYNKLETEGPASILLTVRTNEAGTFINPYLYFNANRILFFK